VARIEFWGGVGVTGSSQVLIHDGGHRVLLDPGLDIPRGAGVQPWRATKPHIAVGGLLMSRTDSGRHSWTGTPARRSGLRQLSCFLKSQRAPARQRRSGRRWPK
jgi:hypothetical protein